MSDTAVCTSSFISSFFALSFIFSSRFDEERFRSSARNSSYFFSRSSRARSTWLRFADLMLMTSWLKRGYVLEAADAPGDEVHGGLDVHDVRAEDQQLGLLEEHGGELDVDGVDLLRADDHVDEVCEDGGVCLLVDRVEGCAQVARVEPVDDGREQRVLLVQDGDELVVLFADVCEVLHDVELLAGALGHRRVAGRLFPDVVFAQGLARRGSVVLVAAAVIRGERVRHRRGRRVLPVGLPEGQRTGTGRHGHDGLVVCGYSDVFDSFPLDGDGVHVLALGFGAPHLERVVAGGEEVLAFVVEGERVDAESFLLRFGLLGEGLQVPVLHVFVQAA